MQNRGCKGRRVVEGTLRGDHEAHRLNSIVLHEKHHASCACLLGSAAMNASALSSHLLSRRVVRNSTRAQSMVEFGLVAPIAFLLIFGIIVSGLYIMNDIRISNVLRDSARAGAICSNTNGVTQNGITISLPNGQSCNDSNFSSYVNSQLSTIDNNYDWSANTTIDVVDSSGTTVGNSLSNCEAGYTIVVSTQYQQQLYLPLVGILFGSPASNSATIQGSGSATCETK